MQTAVHCADNQYVNFSTTAEQLNWYAIVLLLLRMNVIATL